MTGWWTAPTSERDARVELAAAYRAVADFGWTDLGATHLSVAVPGEDDAYLVLREGLFFDEVTASNLVKVGVDGVIRAGEPGDTVNPAAVTIHSALHDARPDVASVMHTHTPAGLALTNHPDGVLPLSQHAMRFWKCHGSHVYEGIALDDDEGPRLAADLADHELLLLQNHGLLTVGPDVPSAFSALYYAEITAQMQLASMSSSAESITIHSETGARTREQYDASRGYMYRDWLGVLRAVERKHPDFAD